MRFDAPNNDNNVHRAVDVGPAASPSTASTGKVSPSTASTGKVSPSTVSPARSGANKVIAASAEHASEATINMDASQRNPATGPDPEAVAQPEPVAQEEKVLSRVLRTLSARLAERVAPGRMDTDYDRELIMLRDQIRDARMEDVPPLLQEMERLQRLAHRRGRSTAPSVDVNSPYFGRLLLDEDGRKREVLIGRGTFLDARTGIRIVDWRDAPVSRLYYRYDEGDDYAEVFGDREVEGEVILRRSLAIHGGRLSRVGSSQGMFVQDKEGRWRVIDTHASLAGGQGLALRPSDYEGPKERLLQLGGSDERPQEEDRHLREITALIDARQFELISRPESGLVVIQGGAGSGKTTIGLHRLAYLAFRDPQRFAPGRMLVMVFGKALANYIERVLPALGVEGAAVETFASWTERHRKANMGFLPVAYTDDTPSEVVRFKKSPWMLWLVELLREEKWQACKEAIVHRLRASNQQALFVGDAERDDQPLVAQLAAVETRVHALGGRLTPDERQSVLSVLRSTARDSVDILGLWAELLTDQTRIERVQAQHADDADAEVFDSHALREVIRWCGQHCPAAQSAREDRKQHRQALGASEETDDADHSFSRGIDGQDEDEQASIDREDDALFLRLIQRFKGTLRFRGKEVSYAHMLIDEAQDLSALELAVVLETAESTLPRSRAGTPGRPSGPQATGTSRRSIQRRGVDPSVTFAGDLAQRMIMNNGFASWEGVLQTLGFDHTAVEPLRINYRSTAQIAGFSRAVLGHLAPAEHPTSTRDGVPVSHFRFAQSGEAVGFLADALRTLLRSEPRASVAVIARYPEQADLYFRGLQQAEVHHVRRVADQDFVFRPGIDVTDVKQVKGLEFDYVVLVETNASSYPEDDASRHLLHIAATRACYQLWVLSVGAPSPLLSEEHCVRVL